MTTQTYHESLHAGQLLLDECRHAGIDVFIGKSGRVIAKHCVGKPYFTKAIIENQQELKLALAHEEAME